MTHDRTAPEVVTVGGAVVDRDYLLSNLPAPDGGAFVREERRRFGGVAANVACGLTRLGRRAGILTRVGRDDDGDAVLEDLREWGVDASRVSVGDEPTTYSMILRDADGRRMIVTGGRSVAALDLDAADLAYARRCDAVFATAYAPDAAVRALLDAGVAPLALDLSGPLEELEGRGCTAATLDAVLDAAALFVADEVSIRSYLGPPETAIDRLRERDVPRAAITLGEDGALLLADGEVLAVSAVDVDVVDTTGAGDAFTAALLHAWLLTDRSPREAGRFAAAAAALNCTAAGARGRLSDVDAIERLLADT